MNRRRKIEGLEIRQDEGSTLEAADGVLRGLAIPFGRMSQDLGGFVEMMSPNLRVDHLDGDVFALAYHDWNTVLGRMTAGTLNLERTDEGITSVITLPDTGPSRDLANLVERGDIRSQSFGFRALDDEWESQRNGPDLRTVKHILLAEVSPVPLPAYSDTTLGLRSLNAHQARRDAQQRRRQLDLLL